MSEYFIPPSIDLEWRRGSDWDIEARRRNAAAAEEYGYSIEDFAIGLLEAVPTGRVAFGGCLQPFRNTRDVVLISTWIAGDNSAAGQEAYCLACTQKHGDSITDWMLARGCHPTRWLGLIILTDTSRQ
jgi:hypothetical protein